MSALALETARCPGCGGDRAEGVYEAKDLVYGVDARAFPLRRCMGCGLVYLGTRPTAEAIAEAYPERYLWRIAATRPANGSLDARLSAFYFRQLYGRRARQVLPLLPDGPVRVLDLGSGGGHFLAALAGLRSGRFLGVDFAVGEAPPGVELLAGDLGRVAIGEAAFDLVTLWHVLEHLHDPVATLAEAFRLLRPGGHLLIATQNFDALSRRAMGPRWPLNDVPRHLVHFTPTTLAPLVRAAGFEVSRVAHATEYFPVLGAHLFPGLSLRPDGALRPLAGLALALGFSPLELLAIALGRACTFNMVAARPA